MAMDQNLRKDFYMIAFDSANHAILTEKQAAARFAVSMIPTPREISSGCGLSLKFRTHEEDSFREFFKTLKVPCKLYHLSEKREDGTRQAWKLEG